MTCPKSLGPSLHAQPEPCDSVVSLGISPIDRHLLPDVAVMPDDAARGRRWRAACAGAGAPVGRPRTQTVPDPTCVGHLTARLSESRY